MNQFCKHLKSILKLSRPQRRRSKLRGVGFSEHLEQRALLSAMVGEFEPASSDDGDDVNRVDILNNRRVSVDSQGTVTVTAGKAANNGEQDRFVIKEGAANPDGSRTAEIWVNGKQAAKISLNAENETTVVIRGSKDADRIDASNAPTGIRIVAKGGAGNDTIYGSRGNDLLQGGKGNDYIDGNAGHDEIQGGLGNDRLIGDAGNDALYGNAGNDTLSGGEGNDVLRGQEGDDYLDGGPGFDDLDESPTPQPYGPSSLKLEGHRYDHLRPTPEGRHSYMVNIVWTSVANASRYEVEITPVRRSQFPEPSAPIVISTTRLDHTAYGNFFSGEGYNVKVRAVFNTGDFQFSRWTDAQWRA